MIHIYYGDDRVKVQAAIRKILGVEYEVIDGEEMDLAGLVDVFAGTSLFGKRKIMIRELSSNKDLFLEILKHVDTESEVVLWESKMNKSTRIYKDLVKAGVELKEFKMVKPADVGKVFEIYDTALRDGAKAIKMVEEIELTNDPYMFVGLMISQAIKKYTFRYGVKEKRALVELSKLDMQMKGEGATLQPWTLVKSFLLRVSSL